MNLVDLQILDQILEGAGVFYPQGEHELKEECFYNKDGCAGALSHTNVHVLLLNYSLMPGRNLLRVLRAAQSITCADGGANRLAQRLREYDLPTINYVFYIQNTNVKKPCMIVGDLDSYKRGADLDPIRAAPDLEQLGFDVVKIVDDSTTDFYKAKTELEKRGIIRSGDTLIVDGAFGGRFDQTISIVSSLYKHRHAAPIPAKWGPFGRGATDVIYNIILVGNETACCLLPRGRSVIRPPKLTGTTICGLLPFVPVGRLSTTGLRWNLEDDPASIDGLCSSSNEVVDEFVIVESDAPIIWYSGLKEFRLI